MEAAAGTQADASRGRFQRILGPVLVLGACFSAHASVLSGGFNWLDHGDILQQRVVLPAADLWRAFTEPFGGTTFYRPFVALTLSLDHLAYGTKAAGYHLTNLLLGSGAALAAYFLLRSFFELERPGATLGAVIAAVHPVTWMSIGVIAGRSDLLATIFALPAIVLYVRARSAGRTPWSAALLFYLALMSKETPLVWVPLLLVVWELAGVSAASSATRARRTREAVLPLAIMALFGCVYLAQRALLVPSGWSIATRDLPLDQAIGTRLASLGNRFLDLFALQPPPLSDAATIVGITHPTALIPLLTVLVGALAVAIGGLHSRGTRALLFIAVALAPALNLLPLSRFNSPHYSYFALPGLGAAVALGWEWLERRAATPMLRSVAAVGITVWILSMGIATYVESYRFRDDLALFGPEVARDPGFREGWHYVGSHYLGEGELELAAAAFERALELDPERIAYLDTLSVQIDLAICRLEQERFHEAEALLEQAGRHAPPELQPVVAFNRALVALRSNRPDLVRGRLGPLADGIEGGPLELMEWARQRIENGSYNHAP